MSNYNHSESERTPDGTITWTTGDTVRVTVKVLDRGLEVRIIELLEKHGALSTYSILDELYDQFDVEKRSVFNTIREMRMAGQIRLNDALKYEIQK